MFTKEITKIVRLCEECNSPFYAKVADIKRGWAKCCSKKCSAKKREKSKPNYSPSRVAKNNIRRKYWNVTDEHGNVPISPSVAGGGSGVVTGYTSEGYRIMDGTAYDEFDSPVYDVDINDDTHPFSDDAF